MTDIMLKVLFCLLRCCLT